MKYFLLIGNAASSNPPSASIPERLPKAAGNAAAAHPTVEPVLESKAAVVKASAPVVERLGFMWIYMELY